MKDRRNSEQAKGFDSDEDFRIEEAEGSSEGRSGIVQESEVGSGKLFEHSDEATDRTIEDWEPINLGSEFEVQEPEGLVAEVDSNEARDGIIADIEAIKVLERASDAVRQIKTEETRQLIAYGITGVFILWTILSLVFLLTTGNAWMLLSDTGPGVLFGLVVNYYFKRPEDER